MTDLLRHNVRWIITHCSDTPPNMDIGAAEIRKWHVVERGWKDIGYHFVIRRDGTIEYGRELHEPGAHVYGHNQHSLGICLVGGRAPVMADAVITHEDNFTRAQRDRWFDLVEALSLLYPKAVNVGHWNLDSTKACPCFDVKTTLASGRWTS